MPALKNLIFDFGNVIIDIDPDLTRIEFAKLLGIEQAIHSREKIRASGLLERYETGKVSEAAFIAEMKEHAQRPDISDKEVRDAWLALLQEIPPVRLEMLKELSKDYTLYMLSNINHSHATVIHEYLLSDFGIKEEEWRGMFTKIYYSHEIGYRKPDADIFEFVLEDANIKAEESLFIDDLEENTATAASLGFRIHTNDPKVGIENVIDQLLKEA